jgi:hypothetical protein
MHFSSSSTSGEAGALTGEDLMDKSSRKSLFSSKKLNKSSLEAL